MEEHHFCALLQLERRMILARTAWTAFLNGVDQTQGSAWGATAGCVSDDPVSSDKLEAHKWVVMSLFPCVCV